jgi:hypothetical protein
MDRAIDHQENGSVLCPANNQSGTIKAGRQWKEMPRF